MFLQTLAAKNERLITMAHTLHKTGTILPDSYVVDVDMLLQNARKILNEANRFGVHLYYMTKQIGRNPYIAHQLEDLGYDGCVAVDFKEAQLMMSHGLKIGHVGHLVQIPKAVLKKIVCYGPEVITVYSTQKAKEISDVALAQHKVQNIMLRIIGEHSNMYAGQEAGIRLNELDDVIKKIQEYKGVKLHGLTSFPCFLFSEHTKHIEPTKNIEDLTEAKIYIEKKYGIPIVQMNMPSVTSVQNIALIKQKGGTHGEPGHALTGTTPFNTDVNSVEIPAYVYVSEISHTFKNKSYFYGGGFYPRGHFQHVLVEDERGCLTEQTVSDFSVGNIDYYLETPLSCAVGNTVLGCFRTQMFVTRSDIVLVKGIQHDAPSIVGIYTPQGIKKDF